MTAISRTVSSSLFPGLVLLMSWAPGPPASAADGGAPADRIVWQQLAALPEPGTAAAVDLVLGGREARLVLTPHSLRGPHFRVRVQAADGGLRTVPPPPSATWRGVVEGVPGSRVVASLVGGELHASVLLPGGGGEADWWSVVPARELDPDRAAGLSPAQVAVGLTSDLAPGDATCATPDAPPSPPSPAARTDRSPATVDVLEIACDADVEYYALNGSSVANTVADIEAVLNGAADLFEFDVQTTFALGDVVVRTAEPDPYATTNPYAFIVEVRTEWRANQSGIERDLVQVFTGKDLAGSAVGIAFTDPGVCSTYDGYSIVQSRYTTAMAYRVADSAHEIGHNCTLYHCNDDEYICRIMCASIGGCSCALHSFGPLSTARLRSYLSGVACLGTAELEFPHATLPFTDNFAAVNLDPAKWTAADNAYPSSGRLQIAHGGGWSPEFYLGTARTLPIALSGRADVSYKVRPLGVIAGQRLWVEYFDTATGTWVMLNNIPAPGGTPADFTTYTHTTPPEAAGDLFSLRFSAYGNQGSSSTDWLVDDVAITASAVEVPAAPAAALLLGARPNPFNPRTAVEVALDRRRRIVLRVFDVTGRELAVLAEGDYDAGRHAFVWEGQESGGRAVPSGTYVVRLESGEIRESRLVSLVR